MKESISRHLGLSDLLEEDLSSYEYYHSLPEDLKRKVALVDVTSFEEMQSCVAELKKRERP